jgi:hypothetical protein
LGAPWQGTHHLKVDTSDQEKKVKLKVKEFQLELVSVTGRRATEREAVNIVRHGSEVLQKTGMKAWEKGYDKWLNGT